MFHKYYLSRYLQFGILIPAGIPLPEKPRMSNEVKSGLKKVSFSNAFGQGNPSKRDSAEFTNLENFALMGLLTTATKPSG